MKICTICQEAKADECFERQRRQCKPCRYSRPRSEAEKARNATRARRDRVENRPAAVMKDCRASDTKHGRRCDLTLHFVQEALSRPCEYCGAVSAGLDRVNNLQGHTVDNVRPACTRCNLVRGRMPWEAWQFVAPAMRKAREAGAFGEWSGPRVGARPK